MTYKILFYTISFVYVALLVYLTYKEQKSVRGCKYMEEQLKAFGEASDEISETMIMFFADWIKNVSEDGLKYHTKHLKELGLNRKSSFQDTYESLYGVYSVLFDQIMGKYEGDDSKD